MIPSKCVLAVIILFSIICIGNTQVHEITLYPGFLGQQYHSNGIQLKPSEVQELLADFPDQLEEYSIGHRQRTTAAVMSLGGLVGLFSTFAFDDNGRGWDGLNDIQKGVTMGGFGLTILGAIIGQSGEKKVIWSYKDYAFQHRLLHHATTDGKAKHALVNNSLYGFDRRKFSLKEHRNALKSSPQALNQFNSSVKLNTIGLTTAGASIAGLFALAATSDKNDEWSDLSTGQKAGVIGVTTGFLGGLVTGLIGRKKRATAFHTFYEDCNCLVQTASPEPQYKGHWSLGPTNNGMGLTYIF